MHHLIGTDARRIGSGSVIFLRFPALAAMMLLVAACTPEPRVDPFRATGEAIAFGGGDAGPSGACFSCHGMKGEGDGRLSPRLAGLDAGYLHRQLDEYVSGRREHALMRDIAKRLSGEDRAKVAAYYAALPASWSPDPAGSAVGARLYEQGDPKRGLQPCAECHGQSGEGTSAGNPPLAGQPAAYLETQLLAWRASRRVNDPLGEMRRISRALSPGEIAAVAAHAAAFPSPRPHPVPATSP